MLSAAVIQVLCENDRPENENVQLENAKTNRDKPFVHKEFLRTESDQPAEPNAMPDLSKNGPRYSPHLSLMSR